MYIVRTNPKHSPPVPAWHALFTRHQHEKPVAMVLSNKGYEVFLPLYRSVRQWQDRNKELWMPLFPSYLFIRGGLDRQLQILTTPGVIHIVGYAGRPAVVPEHQVSAVRQMLGSAMPVESFPYMQAGDRVRVKCGPLMGVEGILCRSKSVSRLVVSMDLLGRSASVEIDAATVERIGPIPAPRLVKRLSISA